MPWYGFTSFGVRDIPAPEVSISIGQILLYVGSIAPSGWLLCDGSEVPIASYQELYDYFVAESLNFGTPANPANFVLPNLNNRFPVGLKTTDTDFDTIGKIGGAYGHSHTNILAGHTHSVVDHVHTQSTVPENRHRHSLSNHVHTIKDHRHGAGTLRDGDVLPGPIASSNHAPDVTVSGQGHDHTPFSGSTGLSGTPNSSPPEDNNGNPYNLTGYTAATTSSTITTLSTGPSSTINANSTGSDNIPPYYSLRYIIRSG